MARGTQGSAQRVVKVLPPDTLKARRAELQAKLDALEAQDAQRHIAIGRAVEKHADTDPAFAAQLRGILERNVTGRGERVCLGLMDARRGGRRAKQASDATAPSAAATTS